MYKRLVDLRQILLTKIKSY